VITEWFAEIAMDFAIWIASLFPEWEVPVWMEDTRGAMVTFLESSVGLGVWVDWSALGICLTAVGVAYVAGLTIRLIRAILAHVPQFGGSGA